VSYIGGMIDILTLADVKKTLYRGDLEAKLLLPITGAGLTYTCQLPGEPAKLVVFDVPFSDIGSGRFLPEMDAKHLIRYIKIVQEL
jgi:hypothetical protein